MLNIPNLKLFLWWNHNNDQYDNQCKDDEDSETNDESQDMFTNDDSSDTTESADDISEDTIEIDQKEADLEDNAYHREHPIFKKCISFKKKISRDDLKISLPFTGLSQPTASLASQTDIEASDMDSLFEQIVSLEKRNDQLLIEFKQVATENFDLKAKNTEYIPFKGKVRQLETQNSVLKEKTIDVRKENDMLVEKIQTLQVHQGWISKRFWPKNDSISEAAELWAAGASVREWVSRWRSLLRGEEPGDWQSWRESDDPRADDEKQGWRRDPDTRLWSQDPPAQQSCQLPGRVSKERGARIPRGSWEGNDETRLAFDKDKPRALEFGLILWTGVDSGWPI